MSITDAAGADPAAGEGARESALEPGARLERRLPLFYASFFYAFPAAIAWIWLHFARPGRSAELWSLDRLPEGIAAGLAAGGVIVILSALASRAFAWARRLEAEFGWILGAQRGGEILGIALLSGFAEEYLFRGALQEKFGLAAATAVFALIHWPVNRNFLPWPFVAGAVGLAFGVLRAWTDALWAPAIAHAAVNYVNLRRIAARFRTWDEERVNAYVETGSPT
ncbi:MAG TPA: CPBP family intramembrane glutamic endopeptidase [Planctomycetota bacterium]|nr:CPBP family intramembrane glutamic endopeptidase [Planctomycetota bacterium]